MSRGTKTEDELHIFQETIDMFYLNECEGVDAYK